MTHKEGMQDVEEMGGNLELAEGMGKVEMGVVFAAVEVEAVEDALETPGTPATLERKERTGNI